MEPNKNTPTFENSIVEIDRVIRCNSFRWKLGAIPSIDRDDIEQLLRIHIHSKWHLYNESLPLGNWLSSVIKNQLKNLLRNHFYKFASPCLGCAANENREDSDGKLCRVYGHQCSECPLYYTWEKNKKDAYDVSLPLTIENHQQQVSLLPFEDINFDDELEDLKTKLQSVLSHNEYKVFIGLYLEGKNEDVVAAEIGFKVNPNSKRHSHRHIKNIKSNIIRIVKEVLANRDK